MKKPSRNHSAAFKVRVALEAIRKNSGSLERRLELSGGPDAWPSSEAWLTIIRSLRYLMRIPTDYTVGDTRRIYVKKRLTTKVI
jgi:hypothetical protein